MVKNPGSQPGKFNPSQRLLSLEYSRAKDKKGSVQFKFYNEDLAYFESPYFIKGKTIEFSFGYAEETSEVFMAVIDGVRGFREIEVAATVAENEFDTTEISQYWPNTSRSTIAQTIAYENGFQLLDIDMVQETRDFCQNKDTNRVFLRSLALDCGFEFFTRLENGILVFHFHAKRKEARPFWKLTWRGGQGNMKDFNITENNVLGMPGVIEMVDWDPDSRTEIRAVSGPQKNSLAPATEVVAEYAPTGEIYKAILAAKAIIPKPLVDMLDAKAQADKEAEAYQEEQMKATAMLVGEPGYDAGYVVELAGLPEVLAGNWFVEAVKHSMGENGYTTELTLMRDSTGLVPSSDEWNAAGGQPNTKTAGDPNALKPVIAENAQTGEIYKAHVKG
jgi:phage protein D